MDKFVSKKRVSDILDCPADSCGKRQRMEPTEDDNTVTDQISKISKTKPDCATSVLTMQSPIWREIRAENLNCDYCVLFNKSQADTILEECERLLTYNEGKLSRVKVFGKWHDIPRKQVAHGDEGLSYTFSNTTVPARPWTTFLGKLKDTIADVTGYDFNFVLINRYKDGYDHIGEHRDDENDLVPDYPIASLSLGEPRDFVFKHTDARGKHARRKIDTVTIELQHGSLLMMKQPTNTYWYHSLPQRKRLTNVRINMTFRKMVRK